ncbi:MAG: hypothetical protein SV910_00660 [Chloroflexota bacterium]|nr:hypothetical protein [Chloroflexota bacterium]
MQEDMDIIVVRPGRCNTCTHHVMGDYDPSCDYREHWCDLEENEREGWFPGMHLDHCVFPATSYDEACPCYETMSLEQALRQIGGELL